MRLTISRQGVRPAPAATPRRGLRIRGEVSAKERGGGGAPPPVEKKLAPVRITPSSSAVIHGCSSGLSLNVISQSPVQTRLAAPSATNDARQPYCATIASTI